jgi:LacI family transcriptional regulator
LETYKRILEERGIPIDDSLIHETNYDAAAVEEAVRFVLALEEPATAIIADDDIGGFVAIDTVREMNLKVPEDVSIMGFGDFLPDGGTRSFLTTYHVPIEDMGREAVVMLENMINDRPFVFPVSLKGRMVERKSCAKPENKVHM